MLFTLEVLPALEGDCLILHWKNGSGEKKMAVIDGGPGTVFEKTLSPRLDELRKDKQLFIDLLMISHVDSDHITGILQLLESMQEEIDVGLVSPAKRRFKVGGLWHNTFNDILGDSIDAYYTKVTATYTATANGQVEPAVEAAIASGLVSEGVDEDEAEHTAADVSAILAGHGESRSVRNTYETLRGSGAAKRQINQPFNQAGAGTLIMAPRAPLEFEGLHVAVYGPLEPEVKALQNAFDKYLKDHQLTAQAALAAYADESIPNLSSIVALVGLEEGGHRKTILLTGDARGDKVLLGLEKAGVKKADQPILVDVLKVPHHGSDRNVEPDFFEQILAQTYVFSADGKNGNPDRPTLEWLMEARGQQARYDIVLTYPVQDIDKTRKSVHEREQKKRAKQGKPTTAWNHQKMSLEALFQDRLAQGYQFKLRHGDGKAPVFVQLGDE